MSNEVPDQKIQRGCYLNLLPAPKANPGSSSASTKGLPQILDALRRNDLRAFLKLENLD